MDNRIEIQTTIKGGLPVLAKGQFARAEPDVGMMHPWIEDLEFFWLSGEPLPKQMDEAISEADLERVSTELLEAANQPE